jgi:REP-associated tyrosine transposase
MNALKIGGVQDHVHLLLSIPASLAVSKAVQLLKGGSSHWLKTAFVNVTDFCLAGWIHSFHGEPISG